MTTPRLPWPSEAEEERRLACEATTQAMRLLQDAQTSLQSSRSMLTKNHLVSLTHLSDATTQIAEAIQAQETIILAMLTAEYMPLTRIRRWPTGAAGRRTNTQQTAEDCSESLQEAVQQIKEAAEHIITNPELAVLLITNTRADLAIIIAAMQRLQRILSYG